MATAKIETDKEGKPLWRRRCTQSSLCADLHSLGYAGNPAKRGNAAEPTYRLAEMHPFEGGGQQFVYLPESGAIFETDETVAAVINELTEETAGLAWLWPRV